MMATLKRVAKTEKGKQRLRMAIDFRDGGAWTTFMVPEHSLLLMVIVIRDSFSKEKGKEKEYIPMKMGINTRGNGKLM